MPEARVRRWLQRLLLLYPRSFRYTMGDDLIDTTVHRWRDMKQSLDLLQVITHWG